MDGLPEYQCHKIVSAAKIADIRLYSNGNFELAFTDEALGTREVSSGYFNKHSPQVGGYYVLYEDGYESWSPAKAFEAGYTLIE